jgi:predicted GNAT family acetyltransferase
VLRTTSLRVLDERDLPDVLAVLERDPVANVFVASRIHAVGLDPWRLGGELWGHVVDGEVAALCYAGANMVLVDAGPEAVATFAERARRRGRRCSSIVGPVEATAELWALLEPHWGPARDVRPDQPLMATSSPPPIEADPAVRRTAPHELDIVLPACIEMFTEEVGVSPLTADGGTLYRSRVGELVSAGRSFARIEDGQVLFKAEIGAVSPQACQVQGVWVHPDYRGEGLSEPGMAAVVRAALADVAPVVSLYVNGHNAAARATYARVGFRDVGTFMSVLF